ncbi:hypothetical protein CXB51_035832 [Gossypium anomalum]|uniref:O-acyltransferase WSD1 C-terminal domain-containing protein n=1 Tax=Gossypium anomalum TaxID=47600 RepID=A0A8J5Y5E4_9ROSI|nr:hypothetical protein CXB51_035832 [Gossypium anomalum]
MVWPGTSSDEPLTPVGCLLSQPLTNIVIHCIVCLENHVEVDAIKSAVKSSLIVQQPRYCSLLVRDKNGLEHWRKTQIDIDRHVVVINNHLHKAGDENSEEDDDDDEAAVNQYVTDLSVSSPLSTDKPLWELHILTAHKCVVFRIDHVLGDGVCLRSMLMAICRRKDDADAHPRIVNDKSSVIKGVKGRDLFWLFGALWGLLKAVIFTLLFSVEFVCRSLLVFDKKTAITGGDGVELWLRKLVTAKFLLGDINVVKKAVPNSVTLHEGLRMTGGSDSQSKNTTRVAGQFQLSILDFEFHMPKPFPFLMKIGSEAEWGNKFGVMLLPNFYHKGGNDPLEFLKRAKAMVDKKKHSLEAYFSYKIQKLAMSLLGQKYAGMLCYKLLCNTTFMISNVVGPLEQITLAGNPVSSIKAIIMHMLSYVDKVEMQIQVAKDIIPDPEFVAKCFEDALLEMKEVVLRTNKEHTN